MGVTIRSTKHDMDMGYGTFYRMRTDIAGMISDQFERMYECAPRVSGKDAEELYADITIAINKYIEEHGNPTKKIFDFLFASDASGQLSYGGCNQLLKLINNSPKKNYFVNEPYGYAGWGSECTHGSHFIQILEDCVAARKPMRWS